MDVTCEVHVRGRLSFSSQFIYLGNSVLDEGFKFFIIFFVHFIDNFVAKCDGYIVQRCNIKHLNIFFQVETGFIVFIDLENPLKVPKIIVLGHIVQVLLRYKVGATPELGPKFREVSAAGGVLPVIGVSDSYSLTSKLLSIRVRIFLRNPTHNLQVFESPIII